LKTKKFAAPLQTIKFTLCPHVIYFSFAAPLHTRRNCLRDDQLKKEKALLVSCILASSRSQNV